MSGLGRRIANMLSRGVVTLANAAGKLQTLQIALLDDEAKDSVEHFEPFGFTSNPHPGAEVLAAFIEGDRSHGIVIVAADRRYRVQNLQPGEVAIYDDHGAVIKLTQTGIVINGGGHPINISGAATVNVTGGDVVADGISLKTHRHGGVQAGAAQTGVPV
jgi:phage baseplate assembly protein V